MAPSTAMVQRLSLEHITFPYRANALHVMPRTRVKYSLASIYLNWQSMFYSKALMATRVQNLLNILTQTKY